MKKERVFSFGVLPEKFPGSVAGLQCGLGFAKLFFWGFGFGKTETEFSRPHSFPRPLSAGGIGGFVLAEALSLEH
ncbi:hypothetical protein L0Y46_04170 [bacterium]|nr:hypothetical protein [bacterium]MCI0680122.1 hypothetical protein [bacterium]